ncbi:hypothetical protein AB0A74_22915 [Saccharothrix sp. NPDC042600]|uniref:hypothetical protein n=1 Tax=Saccharothrix TaxID=2071 RepID=UPI0033F1A27C|nr:hypothetical protein GCM10017745_16250 [Saccharothrix mutabilis subsp. capreolus]
MSLRVRESAADAAVLCTIRLQPKNWWRVGELVEASGLDISDVESAVKNLASVGWLHRRQIGRDPLSRRENWAYRLPERLNPTSRSSVVVTDSQLRRARAGRGPAGDTVSAYSLPVFAQVVHALLRMEPYREVLTVADLVKRSRVSESMVRSVCRDLMAAGHLEARRSDGRDGKARRGTQMYRMTAFGREVYLTSAPGEWEAEVIGRERSVRSGAHGVRDALG